MSRTIKDKKQRWRKRFGIPSWFKKMCKKKRKARERAAIRDNKEPPKYKTSDHWNWW